MRVDHLVYVAALILASAGLSACGGGGGGSTPPATTGGGSGGSSTAGITLNSLDITGTDGKTVLYDQNGVSAAITGSQGGGQFSLTFNTTPSPSGTVEFVNSYLSTVAGGTPNNAQDMGFINLACGMGNTLDPACPGTGETLSCTYDSSQETVGCQGANGQYVDGEFPTYVGGWLAGSFGVPGNYYVVFKACVYNAVGTAICSTGSIPIVINQ